MIEPLDESLLSVICNIYDRRYKIMEDKKLIAEGL